MTQATISVTVHLKDGKLFVTPWVLSKVGFQCTDDIFVAAPGVDGLVNALESAAARAREISKLPMDTRFADRGERYWERAGARSEKEFVKHSTAVNVLLSSKRTEFQHEVPMKDNDGMQAKTEPKTLKAGLSFEQIAQEVLAMLERLG
jgi:hypothetical protein